MKWNSSWLMALCIAGMGAFFVLPALGVSLGGLLSIGLILLCPLSHLLMMRGMHSGRKSCHQGPGKAADGVTVGEQFPLEKGARPSLSASEPVPAATAASNETAGAE